MEQTEKNVEEHALIVTKVDLMIDYLLKNGRLKDSKICRLTGLNMDALDFYLQALENRGIVAVNFSLTGRYVSVTKKLLEENREELINYINKCVEKNFSSEKIKEVLLEAGWERNIVNCAIS